MDLVFLSVLFNFVFTITAVKDPHFGQQDHSADLHDHKISVEQTLVQDLLRKYKKQGRPVVDPGTTVHVKIAFALQQITSLDEREQVMNSRAWLHVEWMDELLTWNTTEYGGIRYLALWPKDIWIPELAVGNSIKYVFDKSYLGIRLIVLNNGTIFWWPGGLYHTTCNIKIFYYPFDDQRCSIVLQQWTYFQREVDLHNLSHSVDLSEYSKNGEWTIYTTTAWKHDVEYPMVTFVLVNIIFPCMLITCLDLMVFLLAPESGEKISLGTTVLLAYTIFMLLIAESVPKTSDTVPIITLYLTSLMVLTTLSVIMSVFVLRVHHRDEDLPVSKPMQLFLKCLLSMDQHRPRTRKGQPVWLGRRDSTLAQMAARKPTNLIASEDQATNSSSPYHRERRASRPSIADDANLLSPRNNDVGHLTTSFLMDEEGRVYFQRAQYRRAAQVFDRVLLFLFIFFNISLALILMIFVPLGKPLPQVEYYSTFGEPVEHQGQPH